MFVSPPGRGTVLEQPERTQTLLFLFSTARMEMCWGRNQLLTEIVCRKVESSVGRKTLPQRERKSEKSPESGRDPWSTCSRIFAGGEGGRAGMRLVFGDCLGGDGYCGYIRWWHVRMYG